MRRFVLNIYRLGIKELYSLARDPVLMLLIAYTFTFAIYSVAEGVKTEVSNASIAIVDEDGSVLSQRLRGAFLQPYFKPPVMIGIEDIDPAMDAGRYTFVLDIPPKFQADVQAGRVPALQLNVDATAMTIAGNGSAYIQNIVQSEIARFLARGDPASAEPLNVSIRAKFNPNLESTWFLSVMQVINNITIMAIILSGAAVIREREHGTIEHLLVMPLGPAEIVLAKIWANGFVIVLSALLSIKVVVGVLIGVPVQGSLLLFALGTACYLFAVTALGVVLATIARSMPQFGLLSIPVFVVMNLLSGSMTPLESMPELLQTVMQAAPSTHFIAFAKAVLYRGAGLDIVWPQLATVAGIGGLLFALALARFRATMAAV